MKATWTNWNRLLLALLLLLALRHDCFCKTMSVCVKPEQSSEHSCCEMASTEESNAKIDANQRNSVHVIQKATVCCCSEKLVFNKPEYKVYSSNPQTTFAVNELLAYSPEFNDVSIQVRKAVVQNDFLKPSKIYLLKRAILD